MYPKDPIQDAQKTDIICHWICPAKNCTGEYIGETNRSLKERVSDHRNQTTSAIRNHHISTIHTKVELNYYTIIDRRSTSHSYQRSITQQKHWQSQNAISSQQTSQTFYTTTTSTWFYPPTFFSWSFNTKDN